MVNRLVLLHLFSQPVSQPSSVWDPEILQHVVARDGIFLSLRYALAVVEMVRLNHGRRFVHPVVAFIRLRILLWRSPLRPWMCHHTREPTVLSRESAQPCLWILTVFTSLACYPGALPTAALKTAAVLDRDRWQLSSPYHVMTTYPINQQHGRLSYIVSSKQNFDQNIIPFWNKSWNNIWTLYLILKLISFFFLKRPVKDVNEQLLILTHL